MKVYLRRVRLNAGGYEYGKWGKYFGAGAPLYFYESGCVAGEYFSGHVRARTREDAKKEISKEHPGKNLKFFR